MATPKRMPVCDCSLYPAQVCQLLAIERRGMVAAGDLISKTATKQLVELGLVEYDRVWAQVTYRGASWLRCAELIEQVSA